MDIKSSFGVLALSVLTASAGASAMRLDATSIIRPDVSGFSVEFNDDGDGLFEIDEMTSFSGVTVVQYQIHGIVSFPTIAGFTNWQFQFDDGYASSGFFMGTGYWSYTLTDLEVAPNADVPEPGTLALAGVAL